MQELMLNLASTLVALAFVLLLAWVLIRGWRRLQNLGGAKPLDDGDALRFVRALPVGARERVVLLDHAGERWMLGVTAGGISVLARWPQAGTPPERQP
ncbi:flagellar protein FliO/FliZ [Pelomonas saccharophila]|uniref:Flagellar protein FliO/FliZ n=1 Tax=Roseateles saccharophilus TaxID=304 RepID=A0ABU1YQC3_ROSSA|nr:flagellar biosynthetic protein FliO [Roseateles saccharophilus]MDR7270943.1 flagellar protein FliO/FliZ [Roseateles saccharophilus]